MKTIHTYKAPAAIVPFSQPTSAGGFLFTSGQIALNPASGQVEAADIAGQTKQVLSNLGALLEAAGLTFEDVVKTTCFLANMEDFAAFNALYEPVFCSKPARSCVAVKQLPKNVLVEIELIARMRTDG